MAKVEWHQGELFPRVGFIVTNLSRSDEGVVKFYNGRGTAEQWIKEGMNAVKWTRLSCHDFVDNQVRLQLFALAYNLGNFLRRLALPRSVKHWSLTTLREKLVKIGAKVVTHARYVTFQMAEVAIPQWLFRTILRQQLATARATIPTGQWHSIVVRHEDNHIECYLNGRKLLEVEDATFPNAGYVGVWTKADAATSFDDIAVTRNRVAKGAR